MVNRVWRISRRLAGKGGLRLRRKLIVMRGLVGGVSLISFAVRLGSWIKDWLGAWFWIMYDLCIIVGVLGIFHVLYKRM